MAELVLVEAAKASSQPLRLQVCSRVELWAASLRMHPARAFMVAEGSSQAMAQCWECPRHGASKR